MLLWKLNPPKQNVAKDLWTTQISISIGHTLVYRLVLRLIMERKKFQDLGENQTHDHHNSGVTALPLALDIDS